MTLLMHERGPFDRVPHSSRRPDRAAPATAHLATIKRVSKFALAVLMVGGALAGIIALTAAISLSRLSY
jgi:hypothetical protein